MIAPGREAPGIGGGQNDLYPRQAGGRLGSDGKSSGMVAMHV